MEELPQENTGKTEDGGPMTEVRGQMAEDGGYQHPPAPKSRKRKLGKLMKVFMESLTTFLFVPFVSSRKFLSLSHLSARHFSAKNSRSGFQSFSFCQTAFPNFSL